MFNGNGILTLLVVLIAPSFVLFLAAPISHAYAQPQYKVSQDNSESAVVTSNENNAVLAVMCHKDGSEKKMLSILLLVNNTLSVNMEPLVKVQSVMWLVFNKNLLAAPADQIQHYLFLILNEGNVESIMPDPWQNRITFSLNESYINAARGVYQECVS